MLSLGRKSRCLMMLEVQGVLGSSIQPLSVLYGGETEAPWLLIAGQGAVGSSVCTHVGSWAWQTRLMVTHKPRRGAHGAPTPQGAVRLNRGGPVKS